MTYKLLRHKHFTEEWEKLPVSIRDQFKKKLAKVIEQPHIPKNMLKGDLAGCYKIKLLKAGLRLVYQVKDDQVVILLITVGKRADSIVMMKRKSELKTKNGSLRLPFLISYNVYYFNFRYSLYSMIYFDTCMNNFFMNR